MALITYCAEFLVPGNDVDAFAGQLVGDRLYPGTAHTHAGAHRIQSGVIGAYRDLGANSRIPRGSHDLDQPLLDLRDFQVKQLNQELRHGPGQDQLRAAGLLANFAQVGREAGRRYG